METRLTVWDATLLLAQKAGITPQQAKAILQAQAELAYEHADEGFPIAGLGVFGKFERPERKMVMQFGPKKGQQIIIPASKGLKFRIFLAAKEIAFGKNKVVPDVSEVDPTFEEKASEQKD